MNAIIRQIQNVKFQQALLIVIKNNNKPALQMTEKHLLISSMEKLINHVRKSRANQEEIFYSLSRNDFKKILSNLEDENPMLRKTSLNLIAQLLSANSKLKKRFCQTMDINLLPGKILFNSKTIQKHVASSSFRNLLILLKKQPDLIQSDCLLWYSSTRNPTGQLDVQYIYRDKTKAQMQIDIDPDQLQNDLAAQYSTSNLSQTTPELSQQSKKMQLKSLIEPNPKKIISIVGAKINSSMSDSQPRYQRNTKNVQPETDRPKKFMNNFLHQRKLNTTKGAETERFNTSTSDVSSIIPSEPSYEISKDANRSTMSKTTQSPYIPVLNLQSTGSNNVGYRTDRIGETYTATNNRAKQMDFQKVKYQGIKITSNQTSRPSYGNNIVRTNNTDRDYPAYSTNGFVSNNSYMVNSVGNNGVNQYQGINNRRQAQNSFNFKYIKPMTASNQEGVKFVNFFPKKVEDQPPLMDKKTIDVFQFIKNR